MREDLPLERVPEGFRHVAGRPVGQQHGSGEKAQAQMGNVGQRRHQPVGRIVFPDARLVFEEARGQRSLRRPRYARPAPGQERLADPDHIACRRDGEEEITKNAIDGSRGETARRVRLWIVLLHSQPSDPDVRIAFPRSQSVKGPANGTTAIPLYVQVSRRSNAHISPQAAARPFKRQIIPIWKVRGSLRSGR